jgi:hypothetical protein
MLSLISITVIFLLLAFLEMHFIKKHHNRQKVTLTLVVDNNGVLQVSRGNFMSVETTIDHTVLISLAIADAKGNPTAAPATPVWTVDTQAVTLTVAQDGLSAVATPVGSLVTANVSVTVGTLVPATVAIDFAAGAPATVTLTTTVQ